MKSRRKKHTRNGSLKNCGNERKAGRRYEFCMKQIGSDKSRQRSAYDDKSAPAFGKCKHEHLQRQQTLRNERNILSRRRKIQKRPQRFFLFEKCVSHIIHSDSPACRIRVIAWLIESREGHTELHSPHPEHNTAESIYSFCASAPPDACRYNMSGDR